MSRVHLRRWIFAALILVLVLAPTVVYYVLPIRGFDGVILAILDVFFGLVLLGAIVLVGCGLWELSAALECRLTVFFNDRHIDRTRRYRPEPPRK